MERYIILLRGINVGGNNIISMKELKLLFENNGFYDVITYINSGNIILSCEKSDNEYLKKRCEAIIFEKFGLHITAMLISAEELIEALCNAPEWWGEDEASKHNAIFVIAPTTAEDVFKEIGAIKPEYEKLAYFGSVIFWSAPIKTFSKTRLSKIVGSSVYERITIRNANTAKKLVQLVS